MGSGKDKKEKKDHKKDKDKKHKKFTAEEDARSMQLYGLDCTDLKRLLKGEFKDKDHDRSGGSTSAWINALVNQVCVEGLSWDPVKKKIYAAVETDVVRVLLYRHPLFTHKSNSSPCSPVFVFIRHLTVDLYLCLLDRLAVATALLPKS